MRRQIQFTCQLFREEDQIVSLCPDLNVSSFGETPAEAEAALQEAVALFLEECERMSTLNEVLEEAGHHSERRETPVLIEEWTPPRPLEISHLELSLAQNHCCSLSDTGPGLRARRFHRSAHSR